MKWRRSLSAIIRVHLNVGLTLHDRAIEIEFALLLNRDYQRLTTAYDDALGVLRLDRYIQEDEPFSHPLYWAGFTCQR